MEKCINISVLCDSFAFANRIQDLLLEKKLIAGCQISKVNSKYWWKGKLEDITEYKLDLKTRISLYKKIYEEIRSIHDYEVFELNYYEINGNKKFLEWINEETKNITKI